MDEAGIPEEEVVTKCDHLTRLKFSPVLPYVFTEHGAIMEASVLNSNHFPKAEKWMRSPLK